MNLDEQFTKDRFVKGIEACDVELLKLKNNPKLETKDYKEDIETLREDLVNFKEGTWSL